jgi:hypothetical protein
MLQETADCQNFQGRYVLRHPYTEPATCDAGVSYRNGRASSRSRRTTLLSSPAANWAPSASACGKPASNFDRALRA